MGLHQVPDVNVIPDTGAVGGGVVVAEDAHMVPLAQGTLKDDGDQVGLGVVVLADAGIGVGAGSVEVAKGGIFDAVGLVTPAEKPLNGQLAAAIGVDGIGAVRLLNGLFLRLAVGGGGGGEHNALHAVVFHGGEDTGGPAHIVVIVFQGVGYALCHQRESGEVDDPVDAVLGKDLLQKVPVPQISLVEPGALYRLGVAGGQVVHHHHIIAPLHQKGHHMTADIAGPAGH